MAQLVKNLPAFQETWVRSLVWEGPLEKGKATHSCVLAWRIPWAVYSVESQKVGHNWVTFTFTLFLKCIWKFIFSKIHSSVRIIQFSSAILLCPTLCNPMNWSTPGFPVYHQLLELAQTHVHRVGDAIQTSHPLSSLSSTFNLSQHQGCFKWVISSHQVAKVLELWLQHQPFQ